MIERVTISIDKRLVEELKSLAKKEGLSLSKLISRSLEEFLIERKKKEAGKKLMSIRLTKEEVREALKELSCIREEDRWQSLKP